MWVEFNKQLVNFDYISTIAVVEGKDDLWFVCIYEALDPEVKNQKCYSQEGFKTKEDAYLRMHELESVLNKKITTTEKLTTTEKNL